MRRIVFAVILFIVAVAGGFLAFTAIQATPQYKSLANPVAQATPRIYPQPDGLTLGDKTSGVKIEAYEDFQCPACRTYAQTIEPEVIDKLVATGKAYYVFRNYPFLDLRVQGGKESHQAANAAMCAADQNRFWEFKDLLFANQKTENSGGFSDDRLVSLAQSAGLNMDKFQPCFEKNVFKPQIESDYRVGFYARIGGTPAIYVNDKNVKPGFVPTFEEIAAAVVAAAVQK